MNILLICSHPKDPTPGGRIARDLLNEFARQHDQVTALMEGKNEAALENAGSITTAYYYSRIENDPLSTAIREKGLFFGFLVALGKAVTRIVRLISPHFWTIRSLRMVIKSQLRLRRYDCVIALADWTDARANALCQVRNLAKTMIMMTEIPVRHRNTKNMSLNFGMLRRINRCVDIVGVRRQDFELLSPFFQKVQLIEYSAIARTSVARFGDGPKSSNHRFLYFGKTYSQFRDPALLLRFMRELPNYQLHFYGGGVNAIANEPNVFVHGFVSPAQMEREIAECAALINIENKNTIIKGSKLISLLGYEKPILSVGEDACLAPYLQSYGAFLNIEKIDKGSEIVQWLESHPSGSVWNQIEVFRPFLAETIVTNIKETIRATGETR